jgi:hypothetical protein
MIENIAGYVPNPARKMWLTLIAAAMEDYRKGVERPAYRYKVDADYFTSEDFAWVCSMAQVDPARVRSNLTRKVDVLN